MRLVDLVKIDHRFEKSVNLLLDLNDTSKLKLYIPTRSSVKLLTNYLKEIESFSGKRANVLVGPYGKGKSHLLLVLMAILNGNTSQEMVDLIDRIKATDEDVKEVLDHIYGTYKLLPVIVNTSGGNLAQAFVRSLNQALKREMLSDVVPENYFSEALRTIEEWKSVYPGTYRAFAEKLGNQENKLLKGLKNYDYSALNQFRDMYPTLTSGSVFNPLVDDDVISVFRSVNRTLCERYGYKGIYIIFDEFSKYVEGHTDEGFAADMKTLQDICELCNASKEEQLHLTCVAHKTIRSYGDKLSKEKKNTFQGVEGRLYEMQFVVSSQNNYELIADAIHKKPAFEKWKENEAYQAMLDESFQVGEFRTLFNKNDFDKIIGEGAFPLTPLSAYLLLGISEKVAQNERTLFTFLTGKDLYSLAMYVEKCRNTDWVGAELIYDYFSQLLAEENESSRHNEWLKAEYAIDKVENTNARKILKAIAIIRIVNHLDDVMPNELFLRLATGLRKEECRKALELLCSEHLIEFKNGIKQYVFKNNIGIDLNSSVNDCITKYYSKVNVPEVVNAVNISKYILPKKYNQDHLMTRYYRVYVMEESSFEALSSTAYLQKENYPDGYLFVILGDTPEAINQHVKEMNDPTVAAAGIKLDDEIEKKVQSFLAVQRLLKDPSFIEENKAAEAELIAWKDTLADEINKTLAKALKNIETIFTLNCIYKVGEKGLNRAISDFAEAVYTKTPYINNEVINRHMITAQTSKARNTILEDILHVRLFEKYNSGTSAESTIYRACMLHTEEDCNLQEVRNEIISFIHRCKGEKLSFAVLVNKLIAPPIGMRKGVLPLYIAEQLMQLEDMPVIYNNKTEITLSAQLLADIVAAPESHYLYIETETVEKLEYIEGLEKLFSEYGTYCRETEKMNRLARVKCFIQAWYRALSQTATTFRAEDYEGQNVKQLTAFRKLLIGEPNPRDLIFEQIPHVFKCENLLDTLREVQKAKKEIDEHTEKLKQKAKAKTREILELSEKDDFLLGLKAWYETVPEKAKSSILSVSSQLLLNSIREIAENGGNDAIEKLSKAATQFYVEDWTDKTIIEFSTAFSNLVGELKEKENAEVLSSQKITIAASDGVKECFYDFDPGNLSPSGSFFQSALDDMIDEYGEALDNNEKIGILMNMVKKLMG